MRLWNLMPLACMTVLSPSLYAQFTTAPTLATPPSVRYPPIAKAAHVSGQVVVDFSIDSEGRTVSVQTVSGPAMLRPAVETQIRQWRFQVPLPPTAQTNFEATYTFQLANPANDLDDDLDAPPYVPCCGDDIALPPGGYTVTGEVRSLSGDQKIDLTAPAAAAAKPCSGDSEPTPPTTTTRLDDFVEMYRVTCRDNCSDYLVRVYRDGRVQWHGWHAVAIPGDLETRIAPAAAEALLTRFQSPDFWSVCSVVLAPRVPEHDPEMAFLSSAITVSIDTHVKSVDLTAASLGDGPLAERLMWAIDKAADTHRWRHGDPVTEPYTNMLDDLMLPKPGITALIRATYTFNRADATATIEPMKRLLASHVDLEASDASGWTALLYAARLACCGNRAMTLLLTAGADVHHASLHGDTALMVYAYGTGLNEELLAAGADINAHNGDGVTALMLVAQHGRAEELERALTAGAAADAQDNLGRTALDYLRAASCGKLILPLPPAPYGTLNAAPVCPSREPAFLKAEAILLAAMRHPSGRELR